MLYDTNTGRPFPATSEPSKKFEHKTGPVGWTCPKCGGGVNPNEAKCPCTFKIQITNETTLNG